MWTLPTLKTLDFTFYIGSTFLYFDLYLNTVTAYAAAHYVYFNFWILHLPAPCRVINFVQIDIYFISHISNIIVHAVYTSRNWLFIENEIGVLMSNDSGDRLRLGSFPNLEQLKRLRLNAWDVGKPNCNDSLYAQNIS